jgi:hypothetical protein
MAVASCTVAAYTSQHSRDDFPEVQKVAIQKTVAFSDPSGRKELVVDNVFGSIQVTGYEGSTVQVDAVQTTRARSKEDIALAAKEVELKISEKANRIELYVDGPFRCRDGSTRSRHFDYQVNYDFQVKVPRQCDLLVKTVTDGDLRVENVTGKFDVENVNGKIQMTDVSGSGRAHTVNGAVKVLFSRNPDSDCSFGSINGDVDVAFPQAPSADLWFKTFNGGAYTDFSVTALPQPVSEPQRRNGKFVYKTNGFYGARVGNGGPQIKFDAFNGNIHVTSR